MTSLQTTNHHAGLGPRPIKRATGVKPHDRSLPPFRASLPTEEEATKESVRKRDALRAIQGEGRLGEDRLAEHADLFRGVGFWDLELRLVHNKRSQETFCLSFAPAGGERSVLVESAAKRVKTSKQSDQHQTVLKAGTYAEYKFALLSKLSTSPLAQDWQVLPVEHFTDFAGRPPISLASISNSSREIDVRSSVPLRNPLREKEYTRVAVLAHKKHLTFRRPFLSPLLPPSSTFHPFPRLAPELRLQILDLARPSPQIIRLKRRAQNNNGHMYSTTTVPGIIQTNAESRSRTLTTFYPPPGRPQHLHPLPALTPIYFSPDRDYLLRGCHLCSSTFSCPPCSQVPFVNHVFSTAKNIVIHTSHGLDTTTFSLLCARYPLSTKVILLAPYTPATGFEIEDLVLSTHLFPSRIGLLTARRYFQLAVRSVIVLGLAQSPFHPLESVETMELAITKSTSDRFGFFKSTFESAFADNGLLRILETPIAGVSPNEVPDARFRVVDGKIVMRKKKTLSLGYLALLDATVPFNRGFGSSLVDTSIQSGLAPTEKAPTPVTRSQFEQIKRRNKKSKVNAGKMNALIEKAWKVVADKQKAEQQLLDAEHAVEVARALKEEMEKKNSSMRKVAKMVWHSVRAEVVRIWQRIVR